MDLVWYNMDKIVKFMHEIKAFLPEFRHILPAKSTHILYINIKNKHAYNKRVLGSKRGFAWVLGIAF